MTAVKRRDPLLTSVKTRILHSCFRFLGEVRTSILLWYLVIMGFFIVVSLPLMYQFIFAEVNARVREDLEEDMEGFQGLLANDPEVRKKLGLVGAGGRDLVAPPTNRTELANFFDAYLSRRVPEDDTFLLGFIGNQLYRSSPSAVPEKFQSDSELGKQWLSLTKGKQGEQESLNRQIGKVIYIVEPIRIGDKKLGTFVVVHTTAGEQQEVLAALHIVFWVMISVFGIALVLTWILAGQIMTPLGLLAKTARSIGESDLTQRIPVRGGGELAELATTFNEMMDRLEVAFATQRNFINDAGHELRTPITIIRGHLELMGDDPQEQEETVTLVMDELDRMTRFVEDLILLAKAERPDFLHLETIELEGFTEELFAKARALADRDWQLDAIAQGQMVGDRQRITQAVMNLAQNATQYTTQTDTIRLGSSMSKQDIRFWVCDTGEGIAYEDQQRIFERFARAANSRRRSEGAGLGLSIVQAIAEAHAGRVNLRSQVGTGATFTLVLPLEPPRESTSYESNSNR